LILSRDKIIFAKMKWVWQVVVAVFLSQGWVLTNYLTTTQVIREDTKPLVLLAMVSCLIIQQVYVNKPKPKDRSAVEKQREIAQSCLNSLFFQYQAILVQLGNPAVANSVRVNLGLPTRDWIGLWFIKIYYYSCQRGQAYSNEELSLKWKRDVGAIGNAWRTKEITLFDSANEKYGAPANSMGERFRRVVGNVGSVVSVPIIGKSGKVIGVLSLDSTANIADTRFAEPEVVKLLQAYADTLQPVCFFDGVYQSMW